MPSESLDIDEGGDHHYRTAWNRGSVFVAEMQHGRNYLTVSHCSLLFAVGVKVIIALLEHSEFTCTLPLYSDWSVVNGMGIAV